MDENLWSLVSRTVNSSGGIEKVVFYLLGVLSLASWCIFSIKLSDLLQARRNGLRFVKLFDNADRFGSVMTASDTVGNSPLVLIFKAAMVVLESRRAAIVSAAVSDPRQIQLKPEKQPDEMLVLGMQNASMAEFGRLQMGLGFLATIGSTAPFIGLFGTVWGIMHTFRDLANMQSASIAVVAPGIAASLIATAAGLAVAIPAVMAYNWFLSIVDDLQDQADSFSDRLLMIIRASGYSPTIARAVQSGPQDPPLDVQSLPTAAITAQPPNPSAQTTTEPAAKA